MDRLSNKLSTATHDYDGTLVYSPPSIPILSLKEALEKAEKAIRLSNITKKKANALKCLILLARKSGNFDSSSRINVHDLIREIMSRDPDPDLLTDVLAEVVTDGPCPEGRSTRLLQLLLALQ